MPKLCPICHKPVEVQRRKYCNRCRVEVAREMCKENSRKRRALGEYKSLYKQAGISAYYKRIPKE